MVKSYEPGLTNSGYDDQISLKVKQFTLSRHIVAGNGVSDTEQFLTPWCITAGPQIRLIPRGYTLCNNT